MPEISRFYGIIIRMYHPDHSPPHFHATYAEHSALIEIDPIRVYRGKLPPRALSLVLEWAAIHQAQLMANWNTLRGGHAPQRIVPLP